MTTENMIAALGLERGAAAPAFASNAKAGTLTNLLGGRAASMPETLVRSLRLVLENHRAGAWAGTLQKSGAACGKALAVGLDRRLREIQAPLLAAMPLETALELLVQLFAAHAWGVLTLDTAGTSSHGVVVAHVEQDYFAGALRETNGFTDPLVAGVLRGYFEHITGQALACVELTCAGSAKCSFVLTTPDRIAPLKEMIGREPAEAVLARLKA